MVLDAGIAIYEGKTFSAHFAKKYYSPPDTEDGHYTEMPVHGIDRTLFPFLPIYTIRIYKAGDSMLSIAVCDDEIIECCNMAKRIKGIMEEMKTPCIIRQFQSGRELLEALESFDIVFLDIIMQDLDGMKTAQVFRKQAFDKILIFMSSSREYVFEAYDVEAFQYLLKPVDDRKLKSVLQKAVLKTERRSQEFIIVSRERQKRKLFLDEIYYFEIKGRVVEAHGSEGAFTYYERIGELEDKLGGKGFFRCHKSYLINLKYVDGYNRQEAVLENGEKIVIAKRRYDRFVQEMLAVMRKNGGII